jgi:hypothetical protein
MPSQRPPGIAQRHHLGVGRRVVELYDGAGARTHHLAVDDDHRPERCLALVFQRVPGDVDGLLQELAVVRAVVGVGHACVLLTCGPKDSAELREQ